MAKSKWTGQARRLATHGWTVIDGGLDSSGYKSGRKRWRETPVAASTAKTRSAGKPRASQLETVPCEPSPSSRAKADCPPTALQASKSASFDMFQINAHTDNAVNAETVNATPQASRMSRKAESEPSPFWKRLTDAWSEQELPISQNGIAQKLKMSQGSVARWFHGEGLPELETCIELAERGKVCVDWLITGRAPKYPISRDPLIREIFEICESLDDNGRTAVLRMARGELLQKQAAEIESAKARQRRA